MKVLVTGGAGYIGSHTLIALVAAGHTPFVVDTFENSSPKALDRVGELIQGQIPYAPVDVREKEALTKVFLDEKPDAVIHFAGLKAVGESVTDPLEYYRVNVGGSVSLLAALDAAGCGRLVFSSSATVYGDPAQVPVPETHALRPTNPYGQTKRMVEQMIEDWGAANPQATAVNLRYFNPVGAHDTAQIGEAPTGVPNNLMPYVAQVAAGQRAQLSVFGDDYNTPDGTGVRDYIHVVDLAQAHLAALELTGRQSGVEAINVGTGRGYSVLEMLRAFEAASGRPVPFEITERRAGDVATVLADPARAADVMGWRATRDLDTMCRDAWAWQSYLETRNSG